MKPHKKETEFSSLLTWYYIKPFKVFSYTFIYFFHIWNQILLISEEENNNEKRIISDKDSALQASLAPADLSGILASVHWRSGSMITWTSRQCTLKRQGALWPTLTNHHSYGSWVNLTTWAQTSQRQCGAGLKFEIFVYESLIHSQAAQLFLPLTGKTVCKKAIFPHNSWPD